MTDLIVFSVESNKYALPIENVQRIIQAVELTNIPNAHECIDGIMSYEDNVLKILNLRKLIGLQGYEDGLLELFSTLKDDVGEWVEALKVSIDTGSEFTRTFDPHMSDLGKWIDGFNSYDDKVTVILAELVKDHKQLHTRGEEAYKISTNDIKEAKRILDAEIAEIYAKTIGALDSFVLELGTVANSLQKLLIYENNGKKFAIKVDSIEDIAHVEETDIMNNSDIKEENSDLLELDGVLDLDGVLINVIKTVNLPK